MSDWIILGIFIVAALFLTLLKSYLYLATERKQHFLNKLKQNRKECFWIVLLVAVAAFAYSYWASLF